MQNPIVLIYAAMYLRHRRNWGRRVKLDALFSTPAPLLLNTASGFLLASRLCGGN